MDTAGHPYNIDEDFAEAMRSIGGVRPSDIDPDVAKGLNADIVFPAHNLIAEVKTLMSDPREGEAHRRKISEVYHRWVGRPGVPIIYGGGIIRTHEMPEEMAFEMVRTLAGPIRSAVTSANRQIRELKRSLKMPSAHGLLVLCNSGATSLTPHDVLFTLHHALGDRHSSINSAIFLTHGVPAVWPGLPEPAEIFATVSRDGHKSLGPSLASLIQDAWVRFQTSDDHPIRVYSTEDQDVLFKAVNVQSKEP